MPLTREQFAIGLAPVLAVWPKETPPAATLEVYYLLLAHIPANMWAGAVSLMLFEKSWGFPKPDAFIEAAVGEVMSREGYVSREWAREWLNDRRNEYLALVAGHAQLEGKP
jgi:hypothetical protein